MVGGGVDRAIINTAETLGHVLRVLLVVAGFVRPLVGPLLIGVGLWFVYPPLAVIAIGLALTWVDRRSQ